MHPLNGTFRNPVGRPYAAVTAIRRGKDLIVQSGSVSIAKPDALFARVPSDFRVISEDGAAIESSGLFMISTETIDPYHLLIDYFKPAKEEKL